MQVKGEIHASCRRADLEQVPAAARREQAALPDWVRRIVCRAVAARLDVVHHLRHCGGDRNGGHGLRAPVALIRPKRPTTSPRSLRPGAFPILETKRRHLGQSKVRNRDAADLLH